jgi:LuxR family maltose regulon positive regulatory protein
MLETMQQSVADLVRAGQEALAQGDWATARAAFEAALHEDETAEAFEGFGLATWWLDDATTASAARERAYQLYRAHDDRRGAARMALWQAIEYLHYQREPAVANGWLQRARQLLEDIPPSLEHGWLAIFDGHAALLFDHDPATTRRLAIAAADLGRALDVTSLEMLGLALEGLALVSEGRLAEGMRCLDAAATAVMAGEVSDLAVAGWTCCYLIYGCERARDYERAGQWCRMMQAWCQRWSAHQLFAFCRTHYAAVLIWQGAWTAAEAELLAVTRDQATDESRMPDEALVRLADLRRLQGRWEETAVLLDQVVFHPLAAHARAALALDHGDAVTAADLVDRFLRRIPPANRAERAAGLELRVRIQLAVGDYAQAQTSLAELEAIAIAVATEPLRAAVCFAAGLVATATGDLSTAQQQLEDALDRYRQSGAIFEATCAQLELARVLHRRGRATPAATEARAASDVFLQLGAKPAAERAAQLLRALDTATHAPTTTPPNLLDLTSREVEVLRLIAAGKSNQEIADVLVLSVRTVERHISTIYQKIGASGKAARATATAYAFTHGLTPIVVA